MSSPTSSTSIMFSSSLSSPTSPSAMLASSSPSKPSTVWQGQLADHCKTSHKRGAVYNIISDRRGGRTAWSCTVTVEDAKYVPVAFSARYWYDGQYVNNAKEDAAEVALQQLGVVPGPRHRYL